MHGHARRAVTAVCALFLMTSVVLVGGTGNAVASDDSGVLDFFRSMVGGVSPAPQAVPAPEIYDGWGEGQAASRRASRSSRRYAARPLTIRPHVVPVPVKPEAVSIYEDQTLRVGDAVMTSRGMRIFAGATHWPYQPTDFIALEDAPKSSAALRTMVVALDRLPNGGALPTLSSAHLRKVGAL